MSWWELLKLVGDAAVNNGLQEQQHADEAYSNATANRQPGMQYESAPKPQTGGGIHVAEMFGNGLNISSGVPMTTEMTESLPGTVKGSKVEARMGDSPQAIGGFAVQPTEVDTNQQPYQNTAMMNYLNYLKYSGGR